MLGQTKKSRRDRGMATVVGYDERLKKRFTCRMCAAIVEYLPTEEVETSDTDEGVRIRGLVCPGCGKFHRTNP